MKKLKRCMLRDSIHITHRKKVECVVNRNIPKHNFRICSLSISKMLEYFKQGNSRFDFSLRYP